jgi:aspartate/methionine/tyrosine aminotransferase
MLPHYMQIWGVARAIGAKVNTFHLKEKTGWKPDLDELSSKVNDQTKIIIVCNPNNPTGARLTHEEMHAIVGIAESVGAWIYADEVYRGAEFDGIETTSFLGMYDKVVVTGGFSKAYALPGLRFGWLAGPKDVIYRLWTGHDYTTISAGAISNFVAPLVLQPERRSNLLERNRDHIRTNLALLQQWMDGHSGLFRMIPPQAGGITFPRYNLDINSKELTERLREEESVFIVAGDFFGMDNFLRIGIGEEKNYMMKALELFGDFLNKLT